MDYDELTATASRLWLHLNKERKDGAGGDMPDDLYIALCALRDEINAWIR